MRADKLSLSDCRSHLRLTALSISLAAEARLFAGVLTIEQAKTLPRVASDDLRVLITGQDGRPIGVWVLSRERSPGWGPDPRLSPVSYAEALRLAGVWLRLRNEGEVACAAGWCPAPMALPPLPRPPRRPIGGRFSGRAG